METIDSRDKINEKTPIVTEPSDIQIEKDQDGNIEVNVSNKWSWYPSWAGLPSWSWKPTSSELLKATEAKLLEASGVTFEQALVKAGNHEINTVKIGSGPPLVLFHGFGAGLGFWISNLKELSKDHTIYAIDLPGFGRSSRVPFSKSQTPEEAEEYFLTSLEQWRQQVKLNDRFTLLGHSFGAYLAASYSLKHPEHIDHLILADPWGIPERPPEVESNNVPLRWKLVRGIANTFNPLSVIRAAGPYGPGLITKFRKDIEMKFSHVFADTSVVSQYIYHLNAQEPSGEIAFASLNASLGWARSPLIGRIDKLHPEIPVTLLYGSHSWMDREAGLKVQEMLGYRAKYHIVPRSGHHIYVDNYDFFNETVLEALKTKRT